MSGIKSHIITIFLFLFGSSIPASDHGQTASECKNEKFVTAEPGTCLDRKAYRLLQAMDHVDKNPYEGEFTKRVLDFLEPDMKKTIDTVVSYPEYTVPVRVYYPTKNTLESPSPAILFIHGGGFMYGSIEIYDMAVKKLAKTTGKIVISVDYRLAPDHPYPAALNDVNAVLEWVVNNRNALGISTNKIALMGDSAGANLVAALTLMQSDLGKDNICCQVLYYPPTTFVEREFPSRVYFLLKDDRSYFLTEEFIRKSKTSYLPPSVEETNPYVSPLEADLSKKLPPTLIITAEVDPLRDDGRALYMKMLQKNQDVIYHEYEGIIHGFLNFYMVFPESVESMKMSGNFISNNLP